MSRDYHRKRRAVAKDIRAVLVERFPKCFMAAKKAKLPLKLGIRDDILAACPDLQVGDVKIFLEEYCQYGPRYLAAIVEGADRVALDGSVDGAVTADQARRAKERLEELNQRFSVAAEKKVAA